MTSVDRHVVQTLFNSSIRRIKNGSLGLPSK